MVLNGQIHSMRELLRKSSELERCRHDDFQHFLATLRNLLESNFDENGDSQTSEIQSTLGVVNEGNDSESAIILGCARVVYPSSLLNVGG